MSDKAKILDKIKHHLNTHPEEMSYPAQLPKKDAGDKEAWVARFQAELENVQGRCLLIKESDVIETLTDLIGKEDSVFISNQPLCQSLKLGERLNVTITNDPDAAVGITAADFLIADTATIGINSGDGGELKGSLLPLHHIVVAQVDQLLPSFEAYMDSQPAESTYRALITGPSRTADIEKMLVLGAHGPKELTVVLIENSIGD